MPSLEIQEKVKSVSLEPKRLKITDDIKPASSHFKYHFLQVSFVHLNRGRGFSEKRQLTFVLTLVDMIDKIDGHNPRFELDREMLADK